MEAKIKIRRGTFSNENETATLTGLVETGELVWNKSDKNYLYIANEDDKASKISAGYSDKSAEADKSAAVTSDYYDLSVTDDVVTATIQGVTFEKQEDNPSIVSSDENPLIIGNQSSGVDIINANKVVLNSAMYGDTLPTSGQVGQLFFKFDDVLG